MEKTINFNDLDYETVVDTYLPDVPKVTTDQPLYPRESIDLFELKQKYRELGKTTFSEK